MFAGAAVGAVGLPPHAANDPIAVATASHSFIIPSKQSAVRIS
jgi:hypothetical protein